MNASGSASRTKSEFVRSPAQVGELLLERPLASSVRRHGRGQHGDRRRTDRGRRRRRRSMTPVRSSTLEMCPSPTARTVMRKRVDPAGSPPWSGCGTIDGLNSAAALDRELLGEVGADEPAAVDLQAARAREAVLHQGEVRRPTCPRGRGAGGRTCPARLRAPRSTSPSVRSRTRPRMTAGSRLARAGQLLAGQEDPADHAGVVGSQDVLGAAHPRRCRPRASPADRERGIARDLQRREPGERRLGALVQVRPCPRSRPSKPPPVTGVAHDDPAVVGAVEPGEAHAR